ncbi:MAG TPA: S24 family peptidase [Alphaproteobacteria bacterium]
MAEGVPDKSWFQQRLKELGKSQRGLAAHLGLADARVTEIFNNRRRVSYDEAVDLAEFLECGLEEIVGRLGKTYVAQSGHRIPVVGYVGAGEVIYPLDDHAQGAGLDEIEPPPDESDGSFAVAVRGNSMAPRFKDGEYLGYSRERGLNPERCFGTECVVQTADGRKLVKILERGSRPGVFTLVSVNAAVPIEHDVVLDWIAPVVWHRLRG